MFLIKPSWLTLAQWLHVLQLKSPAAYHWALYLLSVARHW